MIYKCKICGGKLDVKNGQRIVICSYCGVQQTLPKNEATDIYNLYERAHQLYRNCEYDKAAGIFETILTKDTTSNEAYWDLILCEYGVQYVEDDKSKEYIPTCNRTVRQSIFANENYLNAVKNATAEEKEYYEAEASKINEIQKGILKIVNKEEPFDVFICYKETDKNGRRTEDSVFAQEIYNKLTKEGLKVFFAKITLEDKIGTEYEPYIYAALSSAKVMIVVGTSKENLESIWVKNEWSRYLTMMKEDSNKVLIPCYSKMHANELPDDFSYIQGQDMSKIGFMQDLVYGVKKVVNDKNKIIKKKNRSPILLIFFILLMTFAAFYWRSPNLLKNKTVNQDEKKEEEIEETKSVLRRDISALSGYTFSTKIDELKEKIMTEVKKTEYADTLECKKMLEDGGTEYYVIGWISEDINDETGVVDIIGIKIFYEGDFITEIECCPALYGSGAVEYLSVPENLYIEAKKILGSESEEWDNLILKKEISEETFDYFTGEEVKDGKLYAGRIKKIYINRH